MEETQALDDYDKAILREGASVIENRSGNLDKKLTERMRQVADDGEVVRNSFTMADLNTIKQTPGTEKLLKVVQNLMRWLRQDGT